MVAAAAVVAADGTVLSGAPRVPSVAAVPFVPTIPSVGSVSGVATVPIIPAVPSLRGVVSRCAHRRRLVRGGTTRGSGPMKRDARCTPIVVSVPGASSGAGGGQKETATLAPAVTSWPRPAPLDTPSAATTVGVPRAPLFSGPLPRVGPSANQETPVSAAGCYPTQAGYGGHDGSAGTLCTTATLGTVGTLGTADTLGTLGAPNRPFAGVQHRPLP